MKIYITIDKTLYLKHFQGPYMWSIRHGLLNRKKPMPDKRDWAIDSGGFGEIRQFGKYSFTIQEYLQAVERLNPKLFFNMDWMCEPSILERTGLSVRQHQNLTTENQIKIMEHSASSSEFAGVIQGWTLDDYLIHIDQLKEYGLITPIMGVGSICRRNSEKEIITILRAIKEELPTTKLHGFGVKTSLLSYPYGPELVNLLDSIDSMAWGWQKGCWVAISSKKVPYLISFLKTLQHKEENWRHQTKLDTNI